MKRTTMRSVGATALTTALIFGGAVAASAAPTPGDGPIAGGTTVTVPGPVMKFTDVNSGSGGHTLVTAERGNVLGFGLNVTGALGDGTTTDSFDALRPVQVPAGVTFTQVDAGFFMSLALDEEGNAYQWGTDAYASPEDLGGLGLVPTAVDMPADVSFTAISAGSSAYALGDNGKVYAWGHGAEGQLGTGDTANSTTPVEVQLPAGVTFTQIDGGDAWAIALGSDGKAYSWGRPGWAMPDTGVTLLPTQVGVLPDLTYTQVVANAYHGVVLAANGSAYVWGFAPNLVQPYMDALHKLPPAGVTFTQIDGAQNADYALGSDGLIYAWGNNSFGELGNGSNAASDEPVRVQTPDGITFSKVAAAAASATAITTDGKLYAWGSANPQAPQANGSIPALMSPEIIVTGISFDGIDGTSLVDNGDGTWNIVTPEHAAGPVDVVLEWTLGGVAQTPITYVGGFTYLAPQATPTITNPKDETVKPGGTATFNVDATDADTVVWEVSRDGGKTWEAITVDPSATPSTDGLTLNVVGTSKNNGNEYRATATNEAGDATSESAKLTVTKELPAPTITNPKDETVRPGGTATFKVKATDADTVVWEVSRDGGKTWESITADPDAAPSEDGFTLSVVGSEKNNGNVYRATATNEAGDATSLTAKLAVTQDAVTDNGNDGGGDKGTGAGTGSVDPTSKTSGVAGNLAITGNEINPAFWITALTALLAGAGLITANRVTKRRVDA